MEDDIGDIGASHTTIHKVFTAGTLPSLGLVEMLTEAMAVRARRDKQSEVERIHALWVHAAGAKDDAIANVKDVNKESVEDSSRPTLFMSEIMPDVLEEVEAIGSKVKINNFRVPTGFGDLDALTGGWPAGALIVVGGRPSSGKTSLLLSFAIEASVNQRIPSMFVSAEEDARNLQLRVLSSVARVPIWIMRSGRMSDDDWGRLARTMIKIADGPMAISSSTELSLEQISAEASRLVRIFQMRIMLIDGLPSFIDPDPHGYPYKLESALRTLKGLAGKLGISVVVSVPASRPAKNFDRLNISALAAGDVIERVADVVIVIDRLGQDDYNSERAGEADLIVFKNRYGPEATITVATQAHYSRFVDMMPSDDVIISDEKGDGKSIPENHDISSGDHPSLDDADA